MIPEEETFNIHVSNYISNIKVAFEIMITKSLSMSRHGKCLAITFISISLLL